MAEVEKKWKICFGTEFEQEFPELPDTVQNKIVERMQKLEVHGPCLGRPEVDSLRQSRHNSKMKEMRFDADDGVWRVFFVFDPERKGIILLAANKAGVAKRRFYEKNIREADKRFDRHLKMIEERKTREHNSAQKARSTPARKMKGDRGKTRHKKGQRNKK